MHVLWVLFFFFLKSSLKLLFGLSSSSVIAPTRVFVPYLSDIPLVRLCLRCFCFCGEGECSCMLALRDGSFAHVLVTVVQAEVAGNSSRNIHKSIECESLKHELEP